MGFRIEVLTERYHIVHGSQWEWRPMRPSNTEKPYVWATRKEAETMMDMCYGGKYTREGEHAARVTEVSDDVLIEPDLVIYE
jgi:hypothetical protein